MPQLDQLGDLILSVTRRLGRHQWNEITTPYTQYTLSQDLMMADRRRKEDGSFGLQFNLMTEDQGNSEWTSAYASHTTDVVDAIKQITVNYKWLKGSWGFDEMEISANNAGADKIVDLMAMRRAGSKIAIFNNLERRILLAPSSSADVLNPNGFQYWFVWVGGGGVGSAGAFDGTTPSGFSDVGGLSPTTYPTWRNWSSTYAAFSEADFLQRLYEAYVKTDFRPPVEIPEYGKGVDLGFYTGFTVTRESVKFTRGQNENLGMEMGKSGTPVFFGVPFRYVPLFEDTTYIASGSDPVYGINWKTFNFFGQSGWSMKEYAPMTPPSQPTVRVMYTFLSANAVCNNRRKNFVIAKSTPVV